MTAKGTVRRLVVADVEREYGLDFDREIEVEFSQKPVLVADSIEVVAAEAN